MLLQACADSCYTQFSARLSQVRRFFCEIVPNHKDVASTGLYKMEVYKKNAVRRVPVTTASFEATLF